MKNKGITLIALVITIVLLIILATVTLNLILGDNGIFNRAREAKEQYQNAQIYEETEIGKISNEIDSYVSEGRNDNLASQTSGTATAQDILEGKTAWVNGKKITGTATLAVSSAFKEILAICEANSATLYNTENGICSCSDNAEGTYLKCSYSSRQFSVYAKTTGKYYVVTPSSEGKICNVSTTNELLGTVDYTSDNYRVSIFMYLGE